MSQENMEVVQEVISAVNDRDLDRYLAHCTESIQLETPWAAVEGVYEGPDAIRRFFSDLRDTLPDFQLVIERLEPVGADRISRSFGPARRAERAVLPPGRMSSARPTAICLPRPSSASPVGRSDGSESSSIARTPSKPWGCGSRGPGTEHPR
jgi:SnoaL-like domain